MKRHELGRGEKGQNDNLTLFRREGCCLAADLRRMLEARESVAMTKKDEQAPPRADARQANRLALIIRQREIGSRIPRVQLTGWGGRPTHAGRQAVSTP